MPSLSAKELTTDLLIRYGFQILGALVILGVGLLLARYVGNLTGRWLERRSLEPPVRSLMVKTVRVVVLIFTLVVALDKFGFQVAPLVAGIGVAGLGVGIALQGVLGNLVAGLSIILTKPFRVGEWISIVGVYGQVSSIELFATTLLHPDQSRVIIPNRKIVGEILHNHGTIRQLELTVGVSYATDLPKALAAARETLLANSRVLKTPAPIVAKLNQAINDIINDADTKKRFADLNLFAAGGSPTDMRKLVTEETRRWTDVIRKAGIQPE